LDRPDRACAGWSLLAFAGGRGRGGRSALLAFVPDPATWTAAAATGATLTGFLRLLPVLRRGIGGGQLLRIIRLLIRRHEALLVAAISAGALVSTVIGILRFAAILALLVGMIRMALLVAGILIRAHLAVAVIAPLLMVTTAMLRLLAAMTMTRERGREALTHVLHIEVGDRDFASTDSRPLAFVLRRHDSIIVVGVLQEVLRRDAIASGAGIARELEILLEHLIGVAAYPDIGCGAGAVE
jgi:hypothetical protein